MSSESEKMSETEKMSEVKKTEGPKTPSYTSKIFVCENLEV
jgi:hypothetical protein